MGRSTWRIWGGWTSTVYLTKVREMVVDVLRRFNRSYTQRIGVLDDSYLQTGRPLGPSRLLFEIAKDGSPVLELRRRLGLDSGYVSRLLRQLEDDGLVTVAPDPVDRRQRLVRLTTRGRAERRKLDTRSEHASRSVSSSHCRNANEPNSSRRSPRPIGCCGPRRSPSMSWTPVRPTPDGRSGSTSPSSTSGSRPASTPTPPTTRPRRHSPSADPTARSW